MAKNKSRHVPSDIFPAGVFELQVLYKRRKEKREKIISSEEAAKFARTIVYQDGTIEYVEMLYVLLMDRSNHCFGFKQISSGGICGTYVDPKIIFQTALISHAPCILIIHNHPSGQTAPSIADLAMTKKIKAAGDFLEIKLLDHIILTSDSHYSFSDEAQL